jgi:hypothetical protein
MIIIFFFIISSSVRSSCMCPLLRFLLLGFNTQIRLTSRCLVLPTLERTFFILYVFRPVDRRDNKFMLVSQGMHVGATER